MFKIFGRLCAVFVVSMVAMFMFVSQAKASVKNADVNPPQPVAGADVAPVNCQTADFTGAIWGVGATVTARIYDLDGSVRFARSYTFKIRSAEVGTNNGSGGIGVNYNPNDGSGNRYSTILASVNDLNRKECNAFGTTYYPYVIDSNYSNLTGGATGTAGSDGVSLDCWYDGTGTSRNQFEFTGQSIDDADMAGKSGYWTYAATDKNGNPVSNTIVDSDSGDGVDLNDQSFTIHLDFHVTPPTPALLSTQKYQDGHPYGIDANIPAPINNAKVTLQNQHGPWGGSSGTSNPFPPSGSPPNVWVNQDSPNSYAATPYSTTVEVPPGYRVKRWEIASVGGYYDTRAVHNESTNTVGGIYVKPGSTTWVDFFFEQKTESNMDAVDCAKNGNVTGWVQIPNGSGGVRASDIHLYIDKTAGVGRSADVVIPSSEVKQTGEQYGSQPIYRFNYKLPQQFFDGKSHSVHAYAFDANGTPFELKNSPQSFTCPGSTGNIDTDCVLANGNNSLVGWGFDGQEEAKSPTFAIYIDDRDTARITADKTRNDVLTFLQNKKYPGPFEPNAKYGFEIPDLSKVLPAGVFDGNNHTMNVHLLTKDGTNPSMYKNGVNNTFNCRFQALLHPWLQTYNGDVIASGQVVGQKAGDLGARAIGNPDKEAEYLVISAVGGAGPFCSTTNYILTNEQATNGNCQNGSGYRINGQGLGDSNGDKVIQAINKAWVSNGSGNTGGGSNTKCNPYNTEVRSSLEGTSSTSPVRLATGYGNPSCINGTIIKLNGNRLGNIAVDSGRITIWVTADQLAASNGTLTIDNNIVYNYSPGYDDARKVPNLAIIVDGNVNIDSGALLTGAGVSQLDAAIYATGKINTCSQFSSVVVTSPQNCNKGLIVHGMLAGKNGFGFGRTYTNNGTSPPPAEQVILTGQTVAFPPPGLDNLYFGTFDSTSQVDSGELQPRF